MSKVRKLSFQGLVYDDEADVEHDEVEKLAEREPDLVEHLHVPAAELLEPGHDLLARLGLPDQADQHSPLHTAGPDEPRDLVDHDATSALHWHCGGCFV